MPADDRWSIVKTFKAKWGGRTCMLSPLHVIIPDTLIALVVHRSKKGWVCASCFADISEARLVKDAPPWPEDWEIIALGNAPFTGRCGRVSAHRTMEGSKIGLVKREGRKVWVCQVCLGLAPVDMIRPLQRALDDAGVVVAPEPVEVAEPKLSFDEMLRAQEERVRRETQERLRKAREERGEA